MKRSTVIAGGTLFLVLAGAIGGLAWYKWRQIEKGKQNQQHFEPMETVDLIDAKEATWNPTADLVGTVFALRSVMIRNEFAGVIKTVGFNSGTVVRSILVMPSWVSSGSTSGRMALPTTQSRYAP